MTSAMIFLTSFPACSNSIVPDYANCIRNDDGACILLDHVERVLEDDDLSDEQKRAALRDLGLKDEELIDALIG